MAAPATPARPNPRQARATDWNVGDLALCIHTGPWRCLAGSRKPGPYTSEIRYVAGIVRFWASNGSIAEFLSFASWPGDLFEVEEFVRITPRAEAMERADPAFIADLLPQREIHLVGHPA